MTLDLKSILSVASKVKRDIEDGPGFRGVCCDLDCEDDDQESREEVPAVVPLLDNTEELVTEETVVQEQIAKDLESDGDATMETVPDDQPATPNGRKAPVLASTVQKTNTHMTRRLSPILSPISKGIYWSISYGLDHRPFPNSPSTQLTNQIPLEQNALSASTTIVRWFGGSPYKSHDS